MGVNDNKRFQPVFHRFGRVDAVTNDTTAVTPYGHTHIDSTGIYTVGAPSQGIVKTISLTGNDTAHSTADFIIQTNSSSVTFAGTTFNSIRNTTDLNTAAGVENTVTIHMIGLSTSSWALLSPEIRGGAAASSAVTVTAEAQA